MQQQNKELVLRRMPLRFKRCRSCRASLCTDGSIIDSASATPPCSRHRSSRWGPRRDDHAPPVRREEAVAEVARRLAVAGGEKQESARQGEEEEEEKAAAAAAGSGGEKQESERQGEEKEEDEEEAAAERLPEDVTDRILCYLPLPALARLQALEGILQLRFPPSLFAISHPFAPGASFRWIACIRPSRETLVSAPFPLPRHAVEGFHVCSIGRACVFSPGGQQAPPGRTGCVQSSDQEMEDAASMSGARRLPWCVVSRVHGYGPRHRFQSRSRLPVLVKCQGRLFLVARFKRGSGPGTLQRRFSLGRLPVTTHNIVGLWELQWSCGCDRYEWKLVSTTPQNWMEELVVASEGTDFLAASDGECCIWLVLAGSHSMLGPETWLPA